MVYCVPQPPPSPITNHHSERDENIHAQRKAYAYKRWTIWTNKEKNERNHKAKTMESMNAGMSVVPIAWVFGFVLLLFLLVSYV